VGAGRVRIINTQPVREARAGAMEMSIKLPGTRRTEEQRRENTRGRPKGTQRVGALRHTKQLGEWITGGSINNILFRGGDCNSSSGLVFVMIEGGSSSPCVGTRYIGFRCVVDSLSLPNVEESR